jgi:RES domain-containing protein
VKLWRIAAETRAYPANDLSGASAAKSPGRWNDYGEPVVYCAPTIAIAVLETAAHIDDSGLPLDRFLVELEVPDDVWAARQDFAVAALPPAWSAIPAGQASVKIGSAWLASGRSTIMTVPSIIVPEESAALLSPGHPECKRIVTRVVRQFDYDRLFRYRPTGEARNRR